MYLHPYQQKLFNERDELQLKITAFYKFIRDVDSAIEESFSA